MHDQIYIFKHAQQEKSHRSENNNQELHTDILLNRKLILIRLAKLKFPTNSNLLVRKLYRKDMQRHFVELLVTIMEDKS